MRFFLCQKKCTKNAPSLPNLFKMSLFLFVENGLNAAADRINLVARLNI